MPQPIRNMLHARLTGLDDASLQLLGAAAVIGRSFDGDLVQQVSGRSEDETADGLEQLARAGLTREAAAGDGYDFMHARLRDVVYGDLSLGRRRLLHRRAAEALLGRGRGRRTTGQLAAQIAQHYRLAGRDAEAAKQFKLAGDYARSIYANAEALAHYRDALALGYEDAAALHEAIGDLYTLAGDYSSAITSFEMAAAQSSNDMLAAVEHKLGNVHHRRGEWALAESYYQAALDLFGKCDDAEPCARLLADWSLNAHRNGDDRRAQQFAEQAAALAERSGQPRALAQTHNILGVLARSRGALPEAIAAFERSLGFARRLDDPTARIAALNNLALALADHGEHPRALALLQEALALCASQGDRHREAALHNNIADVCHALGDHDAAMAGLTQAVRLFAEIGLDADAGQWQPEIWKLAEW
jgi:tetratricopeptide (TPR) repeat protein